MNLDSVLRTLIFLLAMLSMINNSTNASDKSAANEPVLAFSDLVNGPATGLGDGLGEGAIVTVWGYHLGDEQGEVFFTDSAGVTRPAAHIYYWKKADGQLPSGPANLYESHRLYEVSFSIPSVRLGYGTIFLKSSLGDISNALPFKVVTGKIFHIKKTGHNKNEGSFTSPWEFINGDSTKVFAAGNGKLNAGDIVYFHGTVEKLDPDLGQKGRAAIFLRSLKGLADAHISLISFPNTQTLVESPTWGIHPYLSTGINISKFTVKGGQLVDPNDNSPTVSPKSPSTVQISTTQNGRVVGNELTDMDGRCSNGYGGAIVGGKEGLDNLKVFGNEIYNIGCRQTSHFHHTTYFTRRSQTGANSILAPEIAWNYLHNNMAKFGIHLYDQTNSNTKPCDQVTGTLKIHNNKIVNQRSVAINVRTTSGFKNSPCWMVDTKIYNNIILNVGLGPIAEKSNGTQPFAMLLGGAIAGTFNIYNNLVDNVGDTESEKYGIPAIVAFTSNQWNSSLNFFNNIVITKKSLPLILNSENNSSNNIVFSRIKEFSFRDKLEELTSKSFKNTIHLDPKVNFGKKITLEHDSPAIGSGIEVRELTHDFYGVKFSNEQNIGPIQ
ncbi:MAG: hypothetical protein NWQ54_02050 [Paraglaciecola sp.]|nr:hypothetical protein [Paraglaciecola sp.]